MKNYKVLSFLFLLNISFSLLLTNCSNNDDVNNEEEIIPITLDNEINDFVWKGLNEIYLWKENISNLSDDNFSKQDDYYTFLNGYNTPENLFDDLLYKKDEIDKFSFLVDDYTILENSFQGNSNTNGLDFRLVRLSGSDDLFGYIRYVANNSDATSKDIKRGEFFITVDGQQLNINNYSNLLFGSNDSYTLGMANIQDGTIIPNNKTVALTKTNFTENPILINKVINANGINVGYLMYNSFIANFDNELNTTIANLKAQGITELVLDLRYNPGGRVSSAIALASMITGQFTGDLFLKEKWNTEYQTYFESEAPEILINNFTDKLLDNTAITSLNLNKVYVLTTTGTASASELIINGLDPYIDVIQIGTNTTGKYTASITLYDSPELFNKENINPNHKYAIQPLVFKSANANGVSDYFNGLTPTHLITYQNNSGNVIPGENITDLGVLGDANEPFLEKALSLITGNTTKLNNEKFNNISIDIEPFADSKDFTPIGKGMYK